MFLHTKGDNQLGRRKINASQNTILDSGRDVTFVSGCSPTLFEQILRGVTGYDLMLEKLLSSRYEAVK